MDEYILNMRTNAYFAREGFIVLLFYIDRRRSRMVEYIIGNYLVDEGKITRDQLDATLKQMDAVRVKLGLIAVAEGFMTMEQVDEVNKRQSICDKRFGDIAIELGYLSMEQVEKLLQEQGNAYFMFVQTLSDLFLLEMEELDSVLDDFKRAKGYTNSEMEDIKSDDVERIIPLFLPNEVKRYKDIIGVAIRTIIRLIDRRVYIGEAKTDTDVLLKEAVKQRLEGNGGFASGFVEVDGALMKVCNNFAGEEFDVLDEDSLDAAGEFLNCLNGLYASERSRQGCFLELCPPEYFINDNLQEKAICKLPVFIKNKQLFFIITEPA